MQDKVYNILFLCTGNSARSIMGEAITNRLGQGRFKGFSGGSTPKGSIHPYTLDFLRNLNHPTAPLRSKSWTEFTKPDAPVMDFVFTVCDLAASEPCPVWPGQPVNAHWGLPDPGQVQGSEAEIRAAFADTYRALNTRLETFMSLPFESLDRLSLQTRLNELGKRSPANTNLDVDSAHG